MPKKANTKTLSPLAEDDPAPRPPLLAVRTRKVRLSARQVLILELLANGATIKEVALRLKLHHTTVRTHVVRAQKRLQARTPAQMFAMAGAAGMWKEDGKYIETL